MLASTVQFSTNNQPPPRTGPTRPDPPQEVGDVKPGTALCEGPAPRPGRRLPPTPGPGPLPQDPTARLRTPAPDTARPPRPGPRRNHGSTSEPAEAGHPNWSAFHPRAPPRHPATRPETGRVISCWHGSAPPAQGLAVECSLERR